MRKHCVKCHIEGEKPTDKIQYIVNCFAVMYLESALKRSGATKDEQIFILSEIIQRYKIREKGIEDTNRSAQ